MGHSSIRAKVRRRKVAQLAAKSRQFDVKNHMKKLAQSKDWKMVPFGTWLDKMPRFGDPKIAGMCYTTDKNGHVHFKDDSWEPQKHKQPKQLRRYKKRKHTGNDNWTTNGVGGAMRAYDTKRHARNDFKTFFKNYPYTLPKMNRVEYMEKYVEHKTKKWERKNPKPMDMFAEDVEKWKQQRETAIERIRDFVVSVYDKLPVMGNIVDRANKKMKAIKIGEVKDVDGKGHNVNHPNLSPNDKLYKHAEAVAMNAMKMDKRILDADLLNHKHDQKRPLNVHRQPIDIKKAA